MMGCAWYRKVPYISKEKPKGYLVIPRQNQKTGQKQSEAVCIPIREAAIKIYCMNNPHLVLAGYDVGKDVEAILIGYILGNEYLTQQRPYFYKEGQWIKRTWDISRTTPNSSI